MIESAAFEGIPEERVRKGIAVFASALETILQDHLVRTQSTRGTFASMTTTTGSQLYWVEPITPGETYPAIEWSLSEDGILCKLCKLTAAAT